MLRFLARVEPATVILAAILGLELLGGHAWLTVAVPNAIDECASLVESAAGHATDTFAVHVVSTQCGCRDSDACLSILEYPAIQEQFWDEQWVRTG
jgi:hypothetical protein